MTISSLRNSFWCVDFSFQCLLSNHFIILDLIKSVWFSVFLHIVWFIVQLPNGLKSFGFERRVLREGSGGGFEKIIEQLPSLPSFDVVTSLACEKFVIRGVYVTELCKFLTPQPPSPSYSAYFISKFSAKIYPSREALSPPFRAHLFY